MDADAIARACAEAMWREDEASRGLGLRLVAVAAGGAELALTVAAAMTNGHGMCHGGFIFALADSAFAFACNSRNQRAVAQHCAVTYVAPAQRGDTLTARAVEISQTGRSGITDVTVTRQDGAVVAMFRGHSRIIGGEIVPGLTARAAGAGTP